MKLTIYDTTETIYLLSISAWKQKIRLKILGDTQKLHPFESQENTEGAEDETWSLLVVFMYVRKSA